MSKLLFVLKKFIPHKFFKKLQPIYHLYLGWLANAWYRHPSDKLIVIGVTGTTGKTTIIYLIAKMLEEAGFKVGYTSTAMFKIGNREWNNDKKMTMMGRFFTQKMLYNMWRENCEYAIIETTSQGIEQCRHRFINYDVVLLTGLYPEHIEAHGSFENYKNAKLQLFSHLQKCKAKYSDDHKKILKIKNEIKKIHSNHVNKTIIVNGDNEHADSFLNFKVDAKYRYQTEALSQLAKPPINVVLAEDIIVDSQGIGFKLQHTKFHLQLMGLFNVSNALAAITVGLSQNIDLETSKRALEKISGVPGRFERINAGQNFTVVIDYAFEPHAVKKLYETISLLKQDTSQDNQHSKVIHVLGSAGGGRDVARRPILGRIAGENADVVIITNEDPYDDDPQIIIDQICLGAEKAGKVMNKDLFRILDRKQAIKKALKLAKQGDIVIITGKGNEQAIASAGGQLIAWDDRKVTRSLIKEMSFNGKN